jgi:hypothetical protein
LRQQFTRSGLHIFKHRKRMQFVSLIRPSPMEDGSLSTSVAEILQVIQGNLNCNRASLAAALLGSDESAIDAARKATLAADLRWLIETGRVIEFSDGRLELPVAPAKSEPGKPEAQHGDHAAAVKAKPEGAPAGNVTAPPPAMAAAQESVAEPQISHAVEAVEAVVAASEPTVPDSIPESEYQPAEPIAEISPSAEQEPISAAPESVAEPRISHTVETVEAVVLAPALTGPEAAPESGYQPAEPIPETPAATEQEPIHVKYAAPSGGTAEPEPAAISPESPSPES